MIFPWLVGPFGDSTEGHQKYRSRSLRNLFLFHVVLNISGMILDLQLGVELSLMLMTFIEKNHFEENNLILSHLQKKIRIQKIFM